MDKIAEYWRNWMPLYPQYKHANVLAIVGMAPTTRTQAPFEDTTKDLWGLNESLQYDWFRRKEPTLWWQIHPVFDFMRKFNRNDPAHWKWLQADHPFPIMMQNVYPDVPCSVAFPLRDMIQAFTMYSTSSVSYMMALAILMGYQRIEIFGVEMSADSEYIYQKACMEYYIGFARGRGIEVYLPPTCYLAQNYLYAYEDLRAASRTFYQQEKKSLSEQERVARDTMFEVRGRQNGLIDLAQDPKFPATPEIARYVSEVIVGYDDQINTVTQKYGQQAGALVEIDRLIQWHDSQNIGDDREDPPAQGDRHVEEK